MKIIDSILHVKNVLGYKSDGEFADAIGINRSNFAQMKKGKRTIGDNVLNKISVHLNVSKNWLLTGEGEMLNNKGCISKIDIAPQINERETQYFKNKYMQELEKNNKLLEDNLKLLYMIRDLEDQIEELSKHQKQRKRVG